MSKTNMTSPETIDTIVAIATPPGRGGVGIVRLSGPEALSIAEKIHGNKPLKPRYAHYSEFYNAQTEIIDAGIVIYFKSPHSFTGEDVIEFQGHGSPLALDQLIQACLVQGARLAQPGEFSKRAFLNDRMDLTQAEAIADLIHANSQTAARMAARSLQGDFSKRVNAVNDMLIHLRLYVEAALDFPEEEIDFLQDGKIAGMLTAIIEALQKLESQTTQGVILREGINIVIAGKPNVGKSTLINALAGKEVAIVTDVAGTTRDVMRAHILLDDIPVHIIDTAGIRDSEDIVEQEGIKRAWEEISLCDCVLLVGDAGGSESFGNLESDIRNILPEAVPVLTVYNKTDIYKIQVHREKQCVYLSAKSCEGLHLLKDMIKQAIGYQSVEGQFLARRRHLKALEDTLDLLQGGAEQLQASKALELLAEDLRRGHEILCTITGEFTPDDLLGKIFSSFCIGK